MAGLSAIIGAASTTPASALVDALQKNLPTAPRQPVLFLGHGSPMNAIEDNAFNKSWRDLGRKFGDQKISRWPKPALILMVSAHWLTRGNWITNTAAPKTIHDFGGFPQALFDVRYNAPGAPKWAAEIAPMLASGASGDEGQWGLDHGAWSVLQPMFPKADIPVLQLSIDYPRAPLELANEMRGLKSLRDRGVLIIGSGNVVHNLGELRHPNPADWGLDFDAAVTKWISAGDLTAAANFQSLGQTAKQAHPTYDHYLPLLYAMAATDAKDTPEFFNAAWQSSAISMRSVIWA